MGTNKSRNSTSSSTTKARLDFSADMRWENANETWDESHPKTWDDFPDKPHATAGTQKTRNSTPNNSNKARN